MSNKNEIITEDTQVATTCFNVVMIRALARVEAHMLGVSYESVIDTYKEQMADLETFYRVGNTGAAEM